MDIFINTGVKVVNKNSGRTGIILKEFEHGGVQVLECIDPVVICTHDSWKTLELFERGD